MWGMLHFLFSVRMFSWYWFSFQSVWQWRIVQFVLVDRLSVILLAYAALLTRPAEVVPSFAWLRRILTCPLSGAQNVYHPISAVQTVLALYRWCVGIVFFCCSLRFRCSAALWVKCEMLAFLVLWSWFFVNYPVSEIKIYTILLVKLKSVPSCTRLEITVPVGWALITNN